MPVKHAQELHEVAEHAMRVAALINQGPLDQFQATVSEMRARGPDPHLQDVERALLNAARAVEDYLRNRTG
ncbi:MAG: hypothetical protein JWO04_3546 [Gammaproteobacteria bacterium]|nr:hypothetical protein [Gammaproteobacteria bacterium]